jgi:hypothetical protein
MLTGLAIQALFVTAFGIPFAYGGYALAKRVRAPTEVAIAMAMIGTLVTAILTPFIGFGAFALMAFVGVFGASLGASSLWFDRRGTKGRPLSTDGENG